MGVGGGTLAKNKPENPFQTMTSQISLSESVWFYLSLSELIRVDPSRFEWIRFETIRVDMSQF